MIRGFYQWSIFFSFIFTTIDVHDLNKGPDKKGRKRAQTAKRMALCRFARLTLDNNHTLIPLKSSKTWKYQKNKNKKNVVIRNWKRGSIPPRH